MGLVQSFVPSAKPMKFSTPIGATFGNSVQWRSPAEVWMMAVGSACAAPSREVEIITTSVCIRVRMDAPVGAFDNPNSTTVDLTLSVERRASPPVETGGTPGAPPFIYWFAFRGSRVRLRETREAGCRDRSSGYRQRCNRSQAGLA